MLSEGQNLQDCGIIINYDLTWNPIRLVQRNGRIDRIGSPHAEIAIYNMFPEKELEALLRLVERLTTRISTIDDLGLLDASVLGEVVHPRTFNTLRRILEGDSTALDEEEERAELAGPEKLLRDLKDMLNGSGADQMTDLPNGIHSGMRRDRCHGMFFYFQAPVLTGKGSGISGDTSTRGLTKSWKTASRSPTASPASPTSRVHRAPGCVRLARQGDRSDPGRGAGGRGVGAPMGVVP